MRRLNRRQRVLRRAKVRRKREARKWVRKAILTIDGFVNQVNAHRVRDDTAKSGTQKLAPFTVDSLVWGEFE